MTDAHRDWQRPPVVEVVLGVQFDSIPGLSNGHLGLFWGEFRDRFPKVQDSPPIEPAVGEYQDEPEFAFPAIKVGPVGGDSRLRMISADGTRMIQLQNGWFVTNWVKGSDSGYPGYEGVRSQFDESFDSLSNFLKANRLGTATPNLWEVTYIDHIERGTVWNDFTDLHRVFPGILGTWTTPAGKFEGAASSWGIYLQSQPGRLTVSIQSARSTSKPPKDILVVRSTARGPIRQEQGDSLDGCLNFGHKAVVETFMALVSDEAKQFWRGVHT